MSAIRCNNNFHKILAMGGSSCCSKQNGDDTTDSGLGIGSSDKRSKPLEKAKTLKSKNKRRIEELDNLMMHGAEEPDERDRQLASLKKITQGMAHQIQNKYGDQPPASLLKVQ